MKTIPPDTVRCCYQSCPEVAIVRLSTPGSERLNEVWNVCLTHTNACERWLAGREYVWTKKRPTVSIQPLLA